MLFIKKIITKNKWFLIPFLVFFAIGMGLIFIYTKAELHLMLNQIHSLPTDIFFKYITYLGLGITLSIVVVILLFLKYKNAISLAISGVITLIIVQGLKRLVFSGVSRPVRYFSDNFPDIKLHIARGVEPAQMFSFPSGHSTSAFVLFFFLTLISKNKYLKFIFFTIAFLTAYSRVYLSWHFTEDIIAGSLLGIIIASLGYAINKRIKKRWANNSLTDILMKKNYEKNN